MITLLLTLAFALPADIFNDDAVLNPGQVIVTKPKPAPLCHREGRAVYCANGDSRD